MIYHSYVIEGTSTTERGFEMKQYRLLNDGEKIQAGDEYYSRALGAWHGLTDISIGYTHNEKATCPVRRLIEQGQPDIPADGESVIVGSGFRRYSAGRLGEYGLLVCYADGKTEWSSEGETGAWRDWRRPTPEELA